MPIKWQDSLNAHDALKPAIEKVMRAHTLPYDAYRKKECSRSAMSLAWYAREYPEAVKLAASLIDTEEEQT